MAAQLPADRARTVAGGSGIFTSIPFFAASVVNIIANWCGDRLLSAESVRAGKRRYLVALCLLLTAAGLLIPVAQSLTAVIVLVSIAASFGNVGPAANGALVGDLLRSSADAGRAFAFLVLGGNTFGLLAPIVTGYIVEATGSFNSAFILAGALALIGAVVTLALARSPIGEVGVPAAVAAQARRLRLGLYRRTEPQAAAGKSRGE